MRLDHSASVRIGVHLDPITRVDCATFTDEHDGPAFVSIKIGDYPAGVSIFLHNLADVDRLCDALGKARAWLTEAENRRQLAKGQPSLLDDDDAGVAA